MNNNTFNEALNLLPMMRPDYRWIAGGSVLRALTGESVFDGDIDVYFKNEQALKIFKADLKIKCASTLATEGESIYCEYCSINRPGKPSLRIQLVKFEYYDNPQAVIDSFDLTICQCLWDGKNIIAGANTLNHIAMRQLHPHNVRYPVSFFARYHKYEARGYHMFNDVMAEILHKIAENPKIIDDYNFYTAPKVGEKAKEEVALALLNGQRGEK